MIQAKRLLRPRPAGGIFRWGRRYPAWLVGPVLAVLLVARLGNCSAGSGSPTESIVQRVVDGDTVVLAGGQPVRYIGMDTPELHHPRKPVQFYAREAAEFNRQLVEGKKVRLEWGMERRDRYNRLLAYVFLEDGTFVNAELLRQGYARVMTIPPNVKYVDLFVKMQKEAKENRRGLWARYDKP